MHGAFRLLLLLPTVTLLQGAGDGAARQQHTADVTGKLMAPVNGTTLTAPESNAYVKRQQGRPALVQYEDQHDRRAFESSFSSYVSDTVHTSASLRVDGDRLLALEKSPHEPLLDDAKSLTHRQASDSRQSPPPSPMIAASSSAPSVASKKKSPLAASSGWAVQVGSFSERKNAVSLRKKLQRAGFSAFEERVVSGGEPFFRVKVGPEASRSRAEALQAMLRDQEDLNGIVVSHPFGQRDVLAQALSDQHAVDKGAAGKSNSTGAGSDKKFDKRLGEAPDEDFREIFAREALVLLAPGEVQLEFSLDYLRDTFEDVSTREGSLFSSVRVGLPFGLEAFINVPFSVREEEIFVVDQGGEGDTGEITVIDDDETGIDNIEVGLNAILLQESETWPSIIGTVAVTEPTGEDPDLTGPLAAVFGRTGIALGTGRRGGTAGLTFLKSSDPAVLFGGLQFTYLDTDSVGGIEIKGGHQIGYSFGMGFAVNDELTMSGLFNGAYLTETELNGQPVQGSDIEPWTFRTGLTYAFTASRYIEPAITFALNDDAVDAIVNLAYVITF